MGATYFWFMVQPASLFAKHILIRGVFHVLSSYVAMYS